MSSTSPPPSSNVQRAVRHWQQRRALWDRSTSAAESSTTTIAISRDCGAGGTTTAGAVANELDWPLYDKELVDKIAHDAGIQEQLLEDLDEKCPNWLAESLEGFAFSKHVSGAGLAIRIKKTLMALYCHGECVVLGRGAPQILPHKRTLSVRLVASEKYRIKRMAEEFDISENEAKTRVRETDRGRIAFVQSYFHKDPGDPLAYDLTLNTSRLDEKTCVGLILTALSRKQQQM